MRNYEFMRIYEHKNKTPPFIRGIRSSVRLIRIGISRHSLFCSPNSHRDRGFTLVEMIVAVGIFAVIMVMATGSLLSLLQANYKAQAQKTVVNNLHFALENISRAIRTGAVYHCDVTVTPVTVPRNCAEESPATSVVVLARDGTRTAYRQNGFVLERAAVAAGEEWRLALDASYVPLTAPEVQIEQLHFFVDGADNTEEHGNNKEQPRILILMRGFMQGKGKVATRFEIETLVSQRQLDI